MTDKERVEMLRKMLTAALDSLTPEQQGLMSRIGMVLQMEDGQVVPGEITKMENQWPTPVN